MSCGTNLNELEQSCGPETVQTLPFHRRVYLVDIMLESPEGVETEGVMWRPSVFT